MPPPSNHSERRKTVVIGGTGFIGRRIVEQLLERGDRVTVIARPGSPRRSLVPDGAEIHEARLDLSDPRFETALTPANGVIYAAGAVRGWTLDDFLPANVRGLEAVVEALVRQQVSTPLIVLSSLAASQPELSNYARSKRLGEEVLRQSSKSLRWVALRPTAVYGPGDKELLPLFKLARRGILPCLGPIDQRLSFIHADDISAAVLAAIDYVDSVKHGIFELDDGRPQGYDRAAMSSALRPGGHVFPLYVPKPLLATVAKLSLHFTKLTRNPPMLTPGKVNELRFPIWIGDNAAFTKATGWMPRYDLSSGAASVLQRERAGA